MDVQNAKRIKIYHKSNVPSQISLVDIDNKLNHINHKLIQLDTKINQIGNISNSIVKNMDNMKVQLNKVITNNEINKETLLKDIGELKTTIIQKLLINGPISNDMLSAYS
jgi:hypothetical protein